MTVRDFLISNGWRLVEEIDLGMTARVFVIEAEGETRVLKTSRSGDTGSLRTEHAVLQHLNGTAAEPYVPAVGPWVDEVGGFFMEHLRFSSQVEREAPGFACDLAAALRALHGPEPPSIAGLEDDRPAAGTAVARRLRASFETLAAGDARWAGLSGEDREKLALVRARRDEYVAMLPTIATALGGARCVLTHGDLSGDNLMVRADGRLALADWGEARIAAALTDVAYLLVHAAWGEAEVLRFLSTYFDGDEDALEDARPILDLLMRLYTYDACVKSLGWLALGDLDAVGCAFFERQLRGI